MVFKVAFISIRILFQAFGYYYIKVSLVYKKPSTIKMISVKIRAWLKAIFFNSSNMFREKELDFGENINMTTMTWIGKFWSGMLRLSGWHGMQDMGKEWVRPGPTVGGDMYLPFFSLSEPLLDFSFIVTPPSSLFLQQELGNKNAVTRGLSNFLIRFCVIRLKPHEMSLRTVCALGVLGAHPSRGIGTTLK